MRRRLRKVLPTLIGLGLFLVAVEVLHRELRAVSWATLTSDILQTPARRLTAALLLTIANYAVLTGYDFVALAYVGRSLSRWRVIVASFLAYAIANNVGFAIFSGASVRYRFYTRWGVTVNDLSRVVLSCSVTFWLGLLALGGLSLAISPLPRAHDLAASVLLALVGWLFMATAAAYLVLTMVRRRPLRVGTFELALPSPGLACAQFVVSAVDWALAGAVFYVLLPPSHATFPTVLGAFLGAQLLGLASHVPGGIGVFEGLILVLLSPYIDPARLLPTLVVYRAVYYLLPLSIAIVGLAADEVRQQRSRMTRVAAYLGRLSERLTPRSLSVFTFLAGLVLLFSGATPAAEGRLEILDRIVPLGVIETSHFIGSLLGAALLLLSQGLARRIDAAYFVTLVAIGLGVGASVLKGGDYEEATLLAVLLFVLWQARPAFDRKAAIFETRFSRGWVVAITAAVVASMWLGLFAFKHVEYSHDLWWQFALEGEASRFLRGSVGAATLLLLFAVSRLMGRAPHETDPPTESDLDAVGSAIASQTSTVPFLVYLRDKATLFNFDRTGFVMYGVQGRTWVALGDPVGPRSSVSSLVRLFLERCADFGGRPVFYEVRKESLHLYADVGLTFVKLGEEARVDLHEFTLDGGQASRFRQVMRRLEKEGGHFRLVLPEEVPTVMNQLQAVSDDWLDHKSAAEKGFSLGFFERQYLSRLPVAVIEREGRIQAFANLWPGPHHEELSIDLMRYHRDAPRDVMEALVVHLMRWGKDAGYRWFALGMAPMSGFERSPVAPIWTRLGLFLYEHGDALYNFQGLRAFKDKFNPVWEPRYLAYPGGLKLPLILADVSALVAGGYRRIFIK